MRLPYAPAELSPEECHHEVAGILAAGILRLRKLHSLAGKSAETPRKTSEDSSTKHLEVSLDTVLTVQPG